jgi:FSR family fosmidomycin resistance protein-like MFS transporter
MLLLAGGHMAVDFAGGALPALLPYFKDRFALSYTLVALLMLAYASSSSIVQPLFGYMSDRRGALWLLPTGVAVAGTGIALAADAPAYWLVLVLVLVSGLGGAAYHPEGSKFAAYASGRKRASGMSAFSIGGNVGYALGPIAAGFLVGWLGLRGGLLIVIPCAVAAGTLAVGLRYLSSFAPPPGRPYAVGSGEDNLPALVLLLVVITFRSFAWFGFITFVPLWEVSLGNSKAHGSHLLSLMLLAGGIGTIAMGPAADRWGTRRVLMISMAATPILMAGYIMLGGAAGAVSLGLVAISIVGTFGLTQVLGQEYLPRRIGMASGLVIGLSVGLGGVGAILLGAVADELDLRTAMWVATALPVVAVCLAAFLPGGRERRLEPKLAGS